MGRGRLPGAVGLGGPQEANVTLEESCNAERNVEAESASRLNECRPSGQSAGGPRLVDAGSDERAGRESSHLNPARSSSDRADRFFEVVLPDMRSSTRILFVPSNRAPGPIRSAVISPGSVAKPAKTAAF